MQRPSADVQTHKRRSPVTIKGTRDGLTFIVHDEFSLEEVLEDLRAKLTGEQAHLFSGPTIRATLSLGNRILSDSDRQALQEVLRIRENLSFVDVSGSSSALSTEKQIETQAPPKIHYGTVRSGMRIEHNGDIVIVGDVNPGAQIIASRDIIVMGTLRGMAHAGKLGDETCIIAAVYFEPTQLRIANVISRSPDGETAPSQATEMEFAYLKDGKMAVDKLLHLPHIRAEY